VGGIEDLKGRLKEAAGAVTGDRSLKREGTAQQDKDAAKQRAAKKEAEADRARKEARAHETRERRNQ
jgi:uncharacterized protein YjbJ (UPF0337 family)